MRGYGYYEVGRFSRWASEQGKRIYDVRITSLPSKAEGQALADALAGKHGVASPRVIQ